jgi:hypothetical protein
VHRTTRWLFVLLLLAGGLPPARLLAQVDPYSRELLQFGYNAAFEGRAPIAAYAFYYRNQPNFLRTNLTLRLAVAPTYLDSELGIRQVLGDDTDLGIGMAGGGFADSYDEIRRGVLRSKESFVGHGAETSVSLYHCFNPDELIPLNGVLRGSARYSLYERDDKTADDFELPDDRANLAIRAGLRWGGKEPILFPSLAMELSIWYEGEFRTDPGGYGFILTNSTGRRDREMNRHSHLFWGQALLAYTMTNSQQSFFLSLTAGTSMEADRFNGYRLGALLPLVAEFPLSLPGYYYQEISARQFVLFGGNYMVPLDPGQRWYLNFLAATAVVDYLPGLDQAGNSHSGVGAGILYKSSSFKVMVGYGYGVDALRDTGRGAHSVGLLMQLDLDRAKQVMFDPQQPNRWRGFQRIFGAFGG